MNRPLTEEEWKRLDAMRVEVEAEVKALCPGYVVVEKTCGASSYIEYIEKYARN